MHETRYLLSSPPSPPPPQAFCPRGWPRSQGGTREKGLDPFLKSNSRLDIKYKIQTTQNEGNKLEVAVVGRRIESRSLRALYSLSTQLDGLLFLLQKPRRAALVFVARKCLSFAAPPLIGREERLSQEHHQGPSVAAVVPVVDVLAVVLLWRAAAERPGQRQLGQPAARLEGSPLEPNQRSLSLNHEQVANMQNINKNII